MCIAFYGELHNTVFSDIKTDFDFINMDDGQRSRCPHVTHLEISYLPGESRKKALYQDK